MNTFLKRRLPLALPWLLGASAAFAQTTTIIDNDSPRFKSSYAWTSSTAGSPTFAGTNHLVAKGLTNIVDNTSPQFSTTGSWQVRTDGKDIYGANFVSTVSPVSHLPYHYPSKVIDNTSYSGGGESGAGGWLAGTGLPGYYGADYQYIEPTSPASLSRVTRFTVGSNGNIGGVSQNSTLRLSAHWPGSPTNASNVVVRVRLGLDVNGPLLATYVVNQRPGSGEWQVLGAPFVAPSGPQLTVEFDATNADGRVIADAIKLESVESYTVNTARWNLPSTSWPSTVDVYARWPAVAGLAFYTAWSVVGGNGQQAPVLSGLDPSQRHTDAAGRWVMLGRVDLQGSQTNYVLLEDPGVEGSIAADAIAYVPFNGFPSASWELETSDRPVDIYVQWSADATRASDARYIVWTYVASAAGCDRKATTVFVDQRDANAATRTYLGRFTSSAKYGCTATRVELMPNSGVGTLSADAVTFVVN